ncbi:MAG: NAD(P)H-hydrate dehydratase [Verrucomicrobia bacterium]|nr:NAD(P)H-hydrate dehydratase [Verrucomicrobiota bacterium]
MIVSCAEMRTIEERAFAKGSTAEGLMEEAGAQMARAVMQFFPVPGACQVFIGKGHNGGDALVAARHLAQQGWRIDVHESFQRETLAPLARKKLDETLAVRELFLLPESAHFDYRPRIVLDGLLGIGAKGALREPIRQGAREINRLRREDGFEVFALDVPCGLDADTGEADPDAVVADFTLCVGFAKRGMLADSALDFVGRLAVLPLAEFEVQPNGETVATPREMAPLLPLRRFSTHKGECGRVGIVAGSRGLTGAAIMAANAAVRAGAGLVSLFVKPDIYEIAASAAMPEVMVRPVDSYLAVLEHSWEAMGIGPGLGHDDGKEILKIIEEFKGPMVVDADALNLLAENPHSLMHAAGPRLLTPHPGEMARLFPAGAQLSRRETAERYLQAQAESRSPVTLLLKSARSLVAERKRAGGLRISWNTAGHPGMASGGMGDVLTGTCAAMAGQGLALFDAGRVGAWICGRAAERALAAHQSQESLVATDLLGEFGGAFRDLRDPQAC